MTAAAAATILALTRDPRILALRDERDPGLLGRGRYPSVWANATGAGVLGPRLLRQASGFSRRERLRRCCTLGVAAAERRAAAREAPASQQPSAPLRAWRGGSIERPSGDRAETGARRSRCRTSRRCSRRATNSRGIYAEGALLYRPAPRARHNARGPGAEALTDTAIRRPHSATCARATGWSGSAAAAPRRCSRCWMLVKGPKLGKEWRPSKPIQRKSIPKQSPLPPRTLPALSPPGPRAARRSVSCGPWTPRSASSLRRPPSPTRWGPAPPR